MTPLNFALPGNPNSSLTRDQASKLVVNSALNSGDFEWISCAVLQVARGQATKPEAIERIREGCSQLRILSDDALIEGIYAALLEDPFCRHSGRPF